MAGDTDTLAGSGDDIPQSSLGRIREAWEVVTEMIIHPGGSFVGYDSSGRVSELTTRLFISTESFR